MENRWREQKERDRDRIRKISLSVIDPTDPAHLAWVAEVPQEHRICWAGTAQAVGSPGRAGTCHWLLRSLQVCCTMGGARPQERRWGAPRGL